MTNKEIIHQQLLRLRLDKLRWRQAELEVAIQNAHDRYTGPGLSSRLRELRSDLSDTNRDILTLEKECKDLPTLFTSSAVPLPAEPLP